jgi:hypothetical protein
MFEHLAGYRVILVSGPHRSGTTIAARMIAEDTGLRFCPEETFGHDNAKAWVKLVETAQGAVIQCPTMCYQIERFGDREDVAVVMVHRKWGDILASQRAVGWSLDDQYRERYKAELEKYGEDAGEDTESLIIIKYARWLLVQEDVIRHSYTVNYEDLNTHPLWLSKEQRRGFKPRQIAL